MNSLMNAGASTSPGRVIRTSVTAAPTSVFAAGMRRTRCCNASTSFDGGPRGHGGAGAHGGGRAGAAASGARHSGGEDAGGRGGGGGADDAAGGGRGGGGAEGARV